MRLSRRSGKMVRGPVRCQPFQLPDVVSPARNLTDAADSALADRGGVMGINLAPDFLSPEYLAAWDGGDDTGTRRRCGDAARSCARRPAPTARHPARRAGLLARHACHAIAIGGEDCIGLGGDLDGITFMPAALTASRTIRSFPAALVAAGRPRRRWRRVLAEHGARVWGRCWVQETRNWKPETLKLEAGLPAPRTWKLKTRF